MREALEILVFSILVSLVQLQSSKPEICIETGTCFTGAWLQTDEKNTFAAFRGIRYAQPPVKELRFKRPQPVNDQGNQTIDVSENHHVICPQVTMTSNGKVIGQEDCLFLNIYVPESAFKEAKKLPVMTFIHGGAFVEGDGTYDTYGPQYFMNHDVIVATMNYRLGTLGFLYLGTEEVSGNAGLRDQSLALQWINSNVESFHGNKSSITIFGESAGSVSVGHQVISPLSRGLFQRAIMQSGSPASSWGSRNPENAKKDGEAIKASLNCSDLQCLQSLNMDSFFFNASQIATHAVPDGEFQEPFLPQRPIDLLNSGAFDHNLDVILGVNKDEGILYILILGLLNDAQKWSDFRKNWDKLGPLYLFDIPEDEVTPEDIFKADLILDFYVGSRDNINSYHLQDMIDMLSDANYYTGTFKFIDALFKYGVNPYLYLFQYHGEFSLTDRFGVEAPVGVSHGDELYYFWSQPNFTLNDVDMTVKSYMVKAWTDFAKNGNPDQNWQHYSPESRLFFTIDSAHPRMSALGHWLEDRINLWETIDGVTPDNSADAIVTFSMIHLLILQYFLFL